MKRQMIFPLLLLLFLVACAPVAGDTTVPPTNRSTSAPPVAVTATAVPSTPVAAAVIDGLIWHDLCQAGVHGRPGPAAPPSGCVPAASGGYQANGLRETGEPGLANVRVVLGRGACDTAVSFAQTTSGNAGQFRFSELAPGQYCLTVNALWPENAHLLPGGWTYPAGYENDAALHIPITLPGVVETSTVQIGWDYQFLPMPDPVTATATISGLVWADHCRLLGGEGDSPATPSAGCIQAADGSYRADGLFNNGERRLSQIQVTLAPGACAGDLAQAQAAVTDENGAYQFSGLAAGLYCVAVDPQAAANSRLLLPGDWTYPVEGVGWVTIQLSAGEIRADVDFGWDHQFE